MRERSVERPSAAAEACLDADARPPIRHEWSLAFGLSAALVWLAQFHHFRDFGLYEDDYWFISEAMGKDPSYLATRLHTAITGLPQGRPLGFFLPDLLSFVGDRLGGLAAIYVLGFVVVTLNTWLCYRLLRTRVPVAPAVVGAAVFCLFPADTTKILLTHDFQLQPSLTFALLSALAYAAGRKPLAYLLSAGALVSYESGFLALFGVPLLLDRWDRRLPRRLAVHAGALVGLLLLVIVLRFAAGEVRATSSAGSLGAIIPALVGSLVLGPARSLAGMVYGPVRAIPTWDAEMLACAVAALLAFTVVLAPLATVARRHAALQVAGAGLAMLVLGYALAFTHFPPNALVGRGTSVHLGATLGMAVLASGVSWIAFSFHARAAVVIGAAYLALTVGYAVSIERDFVRSWQLQRAFWQQVVACCSDFADGTVLLYELNPADEPMFIFTNSWADPLILGETFAFPAAWSNPPRLFSLTRWTDRVERDGDRLRWWVPGASWDEHWETLPQGNVILLRRGPNGGLVRATGTVDTPAGPLDLKPPMPPVAWPPAQLYEPLLK